MRCDGEKHCPDGSDEDIQTCGKLILTLKSLVAVIPIVLVAEYLTGTINAVNFQDPRRPYCVRSMISLCVDTVAWTVSTLCGLLMKLVLDVS
jgi:hypothetical protein